MVDSVTSANTDIGPARTLGERLIREARAEVAGLGHKGRRTITDTVDLGPGAEKVVNLARGRELAAAIRQSKNPEDLPGLLDKALADMRHIGSLFTETIKASFRNFFGST